MSTVRLVPFALEYPWITEAVQVSIGSLVETVVDELPLAYEHAFDRERNQYHSTLLLSYLLEFYPDVQFNKVLGITSLDLFVPILTFVFGEAQLEGPAAVVSSYRLRQEFYGLPADEELLTGRIIKEAVHELGHTLGLIHCRDYECVMHSCTGVEEIDLKGDSFCPLCHRQFELGLPDG